MPEAKKRLSIGQNLARRLLPVSLGIFILISIGFPSVYFILEARALNRSATMLAQEFSDRLTGMIFESPSHWKYQTTKFVEVFQKFLLRRDIVRVHIHDENGSLVSSYQSPGNVTELEFKWAEGEAPIFFNNRLKGSVELRVSTRELLSSTLVLFIFSTVLGTTLASVVYFYPVTVVREMETKIRDLIAAIQDSKLESDSLRVAAQESEQRYRSLVQGLDAVVWEAETSTLNLSFVSSRAQEILGFSIQECLAPGFFQKHLHPDDREGTLYFLHSIQEEKEEEKSFEVEYRIISPLNAVIWVRDKIRLVREGGQKQLRGLMIDITSRKKISDALAEEKERLAVTLRSIQEGVITTDTGRTIVLMNKVAEQLTGWMQEEAAGKKIGSILDLRDEVTDKKVEISVDPSEDDNAFYESIGPKVLMTRNGSKRLIEAISTPTYDSEGKGAGLVVVFRDISEKRRTEEELLKIQKLESIGLLAGGIAHDFNNILTSILGNLSIIKMYSINERKVLERLEDAEKACLRAQDLTTQLLTFSKGGQPLKKLASIIEVLKESANFALRGSTASCKFFISDDLMPAEIDVGQISQVFNNVFINASQAMPNGGTIEVYAENTSLKTGDLRLEPIKYLKISVKDYGVGIPSDYLQKIFDPYFTTKQKGSGLGLATTYSIISKHNGYITVESRPGAGSTFHIYIPASNEQLPDSYEEKKQLVTGKGRVLVMDDEDIIRMILGNMLDELGYDPVFAEDGERAIECYKEAINSGFLFDAVILDLTVRGGMGGADCMKCLVELDPGVKAIVSSGYSDDPAIVNYRELGFKSFITKPYQIEDLSDILYRTIRGIK